ncbi:ATP-binding cassette domain-containing protein [Actinoplanes sp. RD1]|uniref:ATP-binding cassette domain-containing protein n=1 Tax=Actinoplanes sp. RD1 TaxID=3064538 RepID=UPI0027405EC3|nr:ATP-binding cassette domain-containing protein [Actinoplanes sp. RD1]
MGVSHRRAGCEQDVRASGCRRPGSFSVGDGEVFALLGPNGGGKTTIVGIPGGYRTRDSAPVDILGFDPSTRGSAYRARIGVVLQPAGFEEEFTVRGTFRPGAGAERAPLITAPHSAGKRSTYRSRRRGGLPAF